MDQFKNYSITDLFNLRSELERLSGKKVTNTLAETYKGSDYIEKYSKYIHDIIHRYSIVDEEITHRINLIQ